RSGVVFCLFSAIGNSFHFINSFSLFSLACAVSRRKFSPVKRIGAHICALRQSATKTLQNFYALLTETSAGLVVFDGAKCYNNYTSTQNACNNKCGGFLPWAS
uniref:hypothetical protein n=1 Tax=Gemmiger formicilis TaxID=745368 RepID=UPI004026689E